MVDAPELTSIIRRRTVRPLIAAWMFVLVILGTGFVWLSLSADLDPDQVEAQDKAANAPVDSAGSKPTVTIALDRSHLETKLAAAKIPDELPSASDVTSALAADAGHDQVKSNPPVRQALVKAPIDGLVMMGANGPLPVLGPDSMVAWKEYARPQDVSDDRPKIAIVVTDIGLNSKATDLAIKRLPGAVDLAFSPYGRDLQQWMDKAREYGHEGLLMIPTEPLKYPQNDPGPHTLLAGASTRDNLKKLDWLLSQVTGYVGVVNEMGSKFTASEKDLQPILNDLKDRGLMFLDSRSTRFSVAAKLARRLSMPRAYNNLYIDNTVSSPEIARNLRKLENTARTYGAVVGLARAFPLTIREIETWAQGLEQRGFQLVPVTAIANRQPIR